MAGGENSKGLLSWGWWNPKSLATMTTGIFIFISAGMNMAQGLGWSQIAGDHFRFSWFIGVIIGTLITLPLRYFVPEKFIMAGSSVTILIDGIIFTSAPNNIDAVLAARYLNGIAVGLATITFLIHTSEITLSSSRGTFLGIEQYSLAVGIAIQMIYSSQWSATSTFAPDRLHGILDIIFAAVAGGFIWFFIESPMDYFRSGDDAAASECLARLEVSQGRKVPAKVILNELNVYVRQQTEYSHLESLQRGLLPLVKMIFFRSMMLAFSFSLPLSVALIYSGTVNLITWPPIVAACLRIFGCFIAFLLVDNIGRKLPSLFCTVIIGALILGVGIIWIGDGNIFNTRQMSTVASLSLMIQFFAGFFAPFTSAYMGEAFPLKAKPYFMAVCVIVEQVIQIIVICTFGGKDVFLAEAIIILLIFGGLCVTLPETRKTSLAEAEDRFRRLLYLKVF